MLLLATDTYIYMQWLVLASAKYYQLQDALCAKVLVEETDKQKG